MDIKITKTAQVCFKCDHEFVHDEEISSIAKVLEGLLVREDYCSNCCKSQSTANAYCTWTLRFYDPKVAEQEPPEVFSPLRQLFYESLESDSRPELAKAYLAAQLLRRQKVFRLIKESDDPEDVDVKVTLFSDRIGDRLIEVRDPNFSHDEMEEGRKALLDRLSELENPDPEEVDVTTDENTENGQIEKTHISG